MHLVSIIVCMCMDSSDVEWYRRESATRPSDGHTSARLIVNLSVHFLHSPCIECRLLGPAATPPRPLVLLSPPLVAVLPDRYKKSNRKHNCYSMLMISTYKYKNIYKHTQMAYIYINTYIRTCMHTYIYTDNITTVGHRYNDRFIRYKTFIHTSCGIREK